MFGKRKPVGVVPPEIAGATVPLANELACLKDSVHALGRRLDTRASSAEVAVLRNELNTLGSRICMAERAIGERSSAVAVHSLEKRIVALEGAAQSHATVLNDTAARLGSLEETHDNPGLTFEPAPLSSLEALQAVFNELGEVVRRQDEVLGKLLPMLGIVEISRSPDDTLDLVPAEDVVDCSDCGGVRRKGKGK